ncbi:hypothetical protein NBRC116492_20590 [Aurantivibrio infirmus]
MDCELMDAFLFGDSSSPLWGVYHPASFSVDKFEGVVLCYPFGQEYMRSHRAIRQLASMLAQKGFHVLRFDYHGTGDSALDLNQVTPKDWQANINFAIDELKDLAGVERVSLIGLRLGALLAASVAGERKDISRLVVWDPIISGESYLDELKASIAEARDSESASNYIDADTTIHFNGFSMSANYQKNLTEIDLLNENIPECRVLEIVSHESLNSDLLKKHWEVNTKFSFQNIPSPNDWNYVDNIGGILLPQDILNAVCEWI